MTNPHRVWLYHLVHVDNLPSIAENDLFCDSAVGDDDLLTTDIGNQDVKARRRGIEVPISPGGVVADYVPFYFAPRSPMLYAIHRGAVPTYANGQDGLVYLITNTGVVIDRRLGFVLTDHNAASALARFSNRIDDLEEFVDWPLMRATMWRNTEDDPNRRNRRMAEFLVHDCVPWDAFVGLAAGTVEDAEKAAARLGSLASEVRIVVRPRWYF